MKTLCALLLALASAFSVSAQPWCPNIGAQWWHTYAQVGGSYGHVSTTYASDTLIDGVSWQKLRSVATYQDLSSSGTPTYVEAWSLFTGQVDNTVFLRDRFTPDVVDTLYRFDAEIGDRWSVPFMESPELTYVVTDVGVRNVDGVDLSWWAVDVVLQGEESIYYLDTLVERFGFLEQYIYPQNSLAIEPNIVNLRCYSDAEIDQHVVLDSDCAVVAGIDERGGTDPPAILWYDGGSSELKVQLIGTKNCVFQLLDIRGRVMDQGLLRHGITNIPAADLPQRGLFASSFGSSGAYLDPQVGKVLAP
ncbi:MAG: hypothetical protein IPH05_01305 [Flavobacteriales bacterium]|nr:hypothetical protein [Flavobacteriales bacterium]MBK6550252.1 hypothetical protein [Flavobacteriales bacterium]MBK6881584.1 hypothetical protein [Flavobacteriales bacterium]MBK7102900.1 hypothetical protein [Flavobacteriales bacterium]MBK7113495.1 hypothetical protein [Flavobacteriales bacterium]